MAKSLYTTDDVAEMLQVSRAHVCRLAGKYGFTRRNGYDRLFTKEEIDVMRSRPKPGIKKTPRPTEDGVHTTADVMKILQLGQSQVCELAKAYGFNNRRGRARVFTDDEIDIMRHRPKPGRKKKAR